MKLLYHKLEHFLKSSTIGIGAVELATWDNTFSGTSAAGDFGFDPMGQLKGKSAAQVADLKLKEIKNGKLFYFSTLINYDDNI